MKIVGMNAHHFHMVERGTCRGSAALAEQAHFAEKAPSTEIREHQLASAVVFRYLDEANAHQIESIGQVTLAADHLVLGIPHQLHLIAQGFDEIGSKGGENRNATQMI